MSLQTGNQNGCENQPKITPILEYCLGYCHQPDWLIFTILFSFPVCIDINFKSFVTVVFFKQGSGI